MSRYIIRRIISVIPTLIGVTFVIFMFQRLIPGDPAVAMLGEHATDESIARIREQFGLNRPLFLDRDALAAGAGPLAQGATLVGQTLDRLAQPHGGVAALPCTAICGRGTSAPLVGAWARFDAIAVVTHRPRLTIAVEAATHCRGIAGVVVPAAGPQRYKRDKEQRKQ